MPLERCTLGVAATRSNVDFIRRGTFIDADFRHFVSLLVGGVIYRNPALLAKITTTLDIISGGRAILGIGAAWNEEEADAYDIAFPPETST